MRRRCAPTSTKWAGRFIPARAGNTRGRARPSSGTPVHPRSRGEHSPSRIGDRISTGSSPLARGTRRHVRPRRVPHRFIPARAGNTAARRPCRRSPPVHPRSRGEHTSRGAPVTETVGSSPLARGTRFVPGPEPEVARFIPARAGNTSGRSGPSGSPAVHPRSRGEHCHSVHQPRTASGSSPLARGTRHLHRFEAEDLRFIPARAGNTTSGAGMSGYATVHPRSRGEHPAPVPYQAVRSGSSPLARGTRPSPGFDAFRPTVHPRSRGEHVGPSLIHDHDCGSSPLARGTRCRRMRVLILLRFIPARAGNTSARTPSTSVVTVHPRSRGEHHGLRCRPPDVERFIPARAGNTPVAPLMAPPPTVHPRSRGEHALDVTPDPASAGSSPLARGTRPRPPRGRALDRFIPARAGNTVSCPTPCTPSPVHPRSRGEHSPEPAMSEHSTGSSPLARGTREPALDPNTGSRFIPARAGNTRRHASRRALLTVHPRSRGEHHRPPPACTGIAGSSPLARGTRGERRHVAHEGRFIPARAGNTCRCSTTPPGRAVHPRSRGEHLTRMPTSAPSCGSSPLARGTRHQGRGRPVPRRFIPARAGNTVLRPLWLLMRPVHPRSRGEHFGWYTCRLFSVGSSPLARGTPRTDVPPVRNSRFIPARAGNTAVLPCGGVPGAVHPRSRGEHAVLALPVGALAGSSPLARGTPEGVPHLVDCLRFIPARAGNTPPPLRPSPHRPVHPRSRGEHVAPHLFLAEPIGSSPLARGTRNAEGAGGPGTRFIPARAGNTRKRKRLPKVTAVHPRSRGEHTASTLASGPSSGSSPLARGTRLREAKHYASIRFIPARAGNTRRARSCTPSATVHPRSRGEHLSEFEGCERLRGSSPLARGTLADLERAGQALRFIPARAGNTAGSHSRCARSSVHPRSRGEHRPRGCIRIPIFGSSPLARGTPDDGVLHGAALRFIPARAGNTQAPRASRSPRPVHPRSRGEHCAMPSSMPRRPGSSPLARGTPDPEAGARHVHRFIPARAGNTPSPGTGFPARPVHPRSRGEHVSTATPAGAEIGSSPLARGTQAMDTWDRLGGRFIPARAGNTQRPELLFTNRTVHPRSRGEHYEIENEPYEDTGSSPLARGTPRPHRGG